MLDSALYGSEQTSSGLDTLRIHEIPEGVRLEFRLAGPVVRACAWGIDAAIRVVVYIALMILLSFLGGIGVAGMLIGLFLIEWFYPVYYEVRTGATPGKKAMGIWVMQDNGTPLNFSSSMIRNLLRTVDFMPFFYTLGLCCMLLNRDFKRLGDLAAGTVVVYRDRIAPRHYPPYSEVHKPPIELTEQERRAVLAFTERGQRLSASRRIELAELLHEVDGLRGEAAVDRLYAYANWINKGH